MKNKTDIATDLAIPVGYTQRNTKQNKYCNRMENKTNIALDLATVLVKT